MPIAQDLPPWLTGEADRGFLAGVNSGITAARTGTDIAATRQQMSQEAELQPYKVMAADIGNRIQRQTLELGAAMFPLQVQQMELANKAKGVQIVGEGLNNQIKSDELGDAAELAKAQAAWQRGETYNPVFSTKNGLAAHEMWKGNLDLEKANRAEWTAFTSGMSEVATLAPSLIPTLRESLKDGKPTPATFAILDTHLPYLRQQKAEMDRANKLELFKDEQSLLEENRLKSIEAKNAGMLSVAAERAANAKVMTEDAFIQKHVEQHLKMNPGMPREKAVEELRGIYKQSRQEGGAPESPEAAAIKRERDKLKEEMLQFQLLPKGDQKEKDKKRLMDKEHTLEVLTAKQAGRVFNPEGKWQGQFQKGDTVVVGGDWESNDPRHNAGETLIIWPGDAEIKRRLDLKRIKGKQAEAQTNRDKLDRAKWLQDQPEWGVSTTW